MKKTNYIKSTLVLVFLISLIYTKKSQAQIQSMAGPRVGVTLLGAGETADWLTGLDGSPSQIMTQYGWQWESRFVDGGDISGLVEWVLLVGGMERGKFLPSISSLVGFRNDEGFEMGVGPSLSAGGIGMVFGLGFTATSGKLNLPINVVFSPKKQISGAAFSILLGFNMSQ